MDNIKIIRLYLIGAMFVIIAGTLLHFIYAWSGENNIASIFASVNESTWEHLKMFFWPYVLFSAVEYFIYGKSLSNFIPVKFLSLIVGMLTIVVTFYTYTGIIGKNYLPLDILIFVAGVLAGFAFSYKNLKSKEKYTSKTAQILSWLGIILIAVCFIVFTFNPPQIELFNVS